MSLFNCATREYCANDVYGSYYSQAGAPQSEEGKGCEETEGPKSCWRSILEDSVCPLIPFSSLEQRHGCWMVMICADYDLRFSCMLCCHAQKNILIRFNFSGLVGPCLSLVYCGFYSALVLDTYVPAKPGYGLDH